MARTRLQPASPTPGELRQAAVPGPWVSAPVLGSRARIPTALWLSGSPAIHAAVYTLLPSGLTVTATGPVEAPVPNPRPGAQPAAPGCVGSLAMQPCASG